MMPPLYLPMNAAECLAYNIVRLPLMEQDLVRHGGPAMASIMAKIEGIFGVGRRWSARELYELHDICQSSSAMDECERICAYHKSLPGGSKMFPFSAMKMLEGWSELLDRAFLAKKPTGPQKDPKVLAEQRVFAEMALLKARSFNIETKEWLADDRAVKDRARFNELRGVV